jgi:hypothetical protein
MGKQRETGIDDQLRAAINCCGQSANRVSKENRVPQATLSRLLNGGNIRSNHAANLARFAGLELRPKPRK